MIDRYFSSCWDEHWEWEKDEKGKKVWVQQFDRHGEPVYKLIKRPTITGLALFLGTTRPTLLDYEQRDEFFDEVMRAKTLVEYYYEQGAVEGSIHPSVAIFGLKNFGWADKVEITTHNETDGLDLEEVKSHLESLRKQKKSRRK